MIDAVGNGTVPEFSDKAFYEIYELCRQLLLFGNAEDDVYQGVLSRWGEVVIVELASLVGYYSMVAMTLNIHQIPLLGGTEKQLPQVKK